MINPKLKINNKAKNTTDYNTRLKNLNKALRGKLKDLNDRLERVLDKIYVKSLNPNKRVSNENDSSHLIQVYDKELENAKLQYDHWLLEKQKLQEEIKSFSDTNAVIDLEEVIKQLKEKKKDLTKEIADLKYVTLSQGKQLEKLVNEPKELSEADSLIYKLKVLRKKEETLQIEVESKKNVIEALKSKITEARQKADNEAKEVEQAEQKNEYLAQRKASTKNNAKHLKEQEYQNDIDSINIESDGAQESKILADLKKETKLKKLELDKLLIELHERDKENRLLNLKVKELERIVPQNKLNPMIREISSGQNRGKKMKNSNISDANKSVLITKKERKVLENKSRASNDGKISRLDNKEDNSKQLDNKEIDEQLEQYHSNIHHIVDTKANKEDIKSSVEKVPAMGKGLNGEPSRIKQLDKVNPPMKLNPSTFKTEVDIKDSY